MIPEVELDWFFENLLPPSPKTIDVAIVVEHLRKSGIITEEGWCVFSMKRRAKSRHEDVVFSHLNPIFNSILDTVKKLDPSLRQTFTLLLQPKRYPNSERACSTKPDNCWVALEDVDSIKNDPGRFYTWYDIAAPAEDKKLAEGSREQRNKNVAQNVYNMQQIMSLDPCRRFTFGATMQNRQMRVCTEFIWKDESKRRMYKIEVCNDEGWIKSFRTVRILADHAADSTISRPTRVWLVVDQDSVQYVLKDVWLDMDLLPEHEIRAQLLADVTKKCGAKDSATLQKHLLTPYTCGKVIIDGAVDTTDGMMRNQTPPLPSDSLFIFKLEQTKSSLRQSCDPASSASATLSVATKGNSESCRSRTKPATTQLLQTLVLRHKYYYRIIFLEYGHTLFTEKSLLNVYAALTDLLTVVGFTGTSVVVMSITTKDTRKPKLGVFLAIWSMLGGGTLDFMASEVASQAWNYMVPPPRPPSQKGVIYDPPERAPFEYTPLHDLESCLWLLVYILFHNDDAANVLSDPQNHILRNKKTNQLFSRKAENVWRFYFLRDWDTINIHTTGLSPSLEPAVHTVSYFASYLHSAFQET
ncbi:hypothetical protein J3R30DRAFT_3838324 [Lentinula aciculospora]|uniref:Fungal-type protein kinase domain-containing protein n=1 Tax=Lentinula aciculospora TaxID=153920 RepID=A0A9W9AJ39_9AGAR|nr:hypothetical protein J3R30DRAFT_3838324 [Lentinula aciculospora]